MSWEPELDELRRRTERAHEMGGPERVERQHASGRLTLVYHSVWTHTFIDGVFVSVIVDSGTLTGDLR